MQLLFNKLFKGIVDDFCAKANPKLNTTLFSRPQNTA